MTGTPVDASPGTPPTPARWRALLLRPWVVAGVPLAALALYPVIRPYDIYQQTVLLLAFLLAIQAVSWNIIAGYAGYVSLGHSAFLGLGAYTAGIVASRTGVNPLLVAPLGGVVALVAALLIGLVVLRTRGHAFVIITIALLLSMQVLVTNFRSLTNGSDGITLELPQWSRDIQSLPFYGMFYVLMLLTIAFSAWVRRTKLGTGLMAIREDEGKAAVVGVDTTRYKVIAYCASAVPIGVAGSVYAYFLTFLNPGGAFAILGSVTIVLAALVGGRGTLWGPVIGAFLVQLASELATVYGGGSQSRVLLFGAALTLVVLFLPAGLLPTVAARLGTPGGVVEYTDQSGALARGRLELRERDATPALSAALPAGSLPAGSAPAGSADSGPLLEVRGVRKRFGGIVAVDGADLAVDRGTITALIGPNGSGKTTLFNLVTGTMRADAGEVWFDGRRIDRLRPWTRGHLGLGRTFQITRLFKSMTVLENVVAPLPDARWGTMLRTAVSGPEAERARHLLDFMGLGRLSGQPAGMLSYGQQKLVELAQVLMMEPQLVLLDEPAGGVNPSLVGRLGEIVRDLNAQGITFLVVEHNIPMVLGLCDPVVVFARGKPIAQGPPDLIRADPVVLDAYLGQEWATAPSAQPAPAGSAGPGR